MLNHVVEAGRVGMPRALFSRHAQACSTGTATARRPTPSRWQLTRGAVTRFASGNCPGSRVHGGGGSSAVGVFARRSTASAGVATGVATRPEGRPGSPAADGASASAMAARRASAAAMSCASAFESRPRCARRCKAPFHPRGRSHTADQRVQSGRARFERGLLVERLGKLREQRAVARAVDRSAIRWRRSGQRVATLVGRIGVRPRVPVQVMLWSQ